MVVVVVMMMLMKMIVTSSSAFPAISLGFAIFVEIFV